MSQPKPDALLCHIQRSRFDTDDDPEPRVDLFEVGDLATTLVSPGKRETTSVYHLQEQAQESLAASVPGPRHCSIAIRNAC